MYLNRNIFIVIGIMIAALAAVIFIGFKIFKTPNLPPTATSTSTTTVPFPTSTSTSTSTKPSPKKATSTPAAPKLKWGAYVGDGRTDLADFEKMVGRSTNILADFESWEAEFPLHFQSNVGEKGKTLVVFWEPSFGYDVINSGIKDDYIKRFATNAKIYGYPVILAPFDEMNLNESDWGYGQNGNTAKKFVSAWKRIHEIFQSVGAKNVKFAITYNNVSIPNVKGNRFTDYYPGSSYVDYVAVDGFNFGTPWLTVPELFDEAISELSKFNKPIYIMSFGSVPGSRKAEWIKQFGSYIKNYPKVIGWVYFNYNSDANWLVNTDSNSLKAFKEIIP